INSVLTSGGLITGNLSLLYSQAIAIVIVGAYAFIMTWIIGKVLDKVIGLRVAPQDEVNGLDVNLHEESGYRLS
ncbi:MAG: ammonia channel protein, partial [Methanobacteriaceae archaeon]|nr:ammonia channel protein [Methanobacteriaceae archaeon]